MPATVTPSTQNRRADPGGRPVAATSPSAVIARTATTGTHHNASILLMRSLLRQGSLCQGSCGAGYS